MKTTFNGLSAPIRPVCGRLDSAIDDCICLTAPSGTRSPSCWTEPSERSSVPDGRLTAPALCRPALVDARH